MCPLFYLCDELSRFKEEFRLFGYESIEKMVQDNITLEHF